MQLPPGVLGDRAEPARPTNSRGGCSDDRSGTSRSIPGTRPGLSGREHGRRGAARRPCAGGRPDADRVTAPERGRDLQRVSDRSRSAPDLRAGVLLRGQHLVRPVQEPDDRAAAREPEAVQRDRDRRVDERELGKRHRRRLPVAAAAARRAGLRLRRGDLAAGHRELPAQLGSAPIRQPQHDRRRDRAAGRVRDVLAGRCRAARERQRCRSARRTRGEAPDRDRPVAVVEPAHHLRQHDPRTRARAGLRRVHSARGRPCADALPGAGRQAELRERGAGLLRTARRVGSAVSVRGGGRDGAPAARGHHVRHRASPAGARNLPDLSVPARGSRRPGPDRSGPARLRRPSRQVDPHRAGPARGAADRHDAVADQSEHTA